jgi:hypothetical protein
MRDSVYRESDFGAFFEVSLTLGADGDSGDRLRSPSDIAEDPLGNIYVADELRHEVIKFSASGRFLRGLGSEGPAPGQFRYPTSLSITYRGEIAVTDRWNHRVQVLTSDGGPGITFGSYGTSPGDFHEPWGLAASTRGNLLVADHGNHRIQIFTREGGLLGTFGKPGLSLDYYESNEFKSGYVFDRWQQSVSRFTPIETSFHDSGYEVGNLEFPRWINSLSGDTFLVADTSGSIHLVDAEGTFTGHVRIDLRDEQGPFLPTAGIALPGGTILACDECRDELVAVPAATEERLLLKGLPHSVSNMRFLPSGRMALCHRWKGEVSIAVPRNGL